MDPERCEEQTPVQFRSQKVSGEASSEMRNVSETVLGDKAEERKDLADSFVLPTPEKSVWESRSRETVSLARKQLAEDFDDEEQVSDVRSRVGTKDCLVELPEKYKILADLFSRMETSIRLLGLRKISPTFESISKQVEILTKRKFLCSHLAQMKYIFSEAINVERILVHDKESLVMVPQMKITLNKLAVEQTSGSYQSASVALCDAFGERLLNYFITHPEATEIPEAVLPDPFDKSQDDHRISTLKALSEGRKNELSCEIAGEPDLLSTASHLPSSFRKRFPKVPIAEEGCQNELLSNKEFSNPSSTNDHIMGVASPQNLEGPSLSTETPAKVVSVLKQSIVSQMTESTPSKGASNLGVVVTETPASKTPKRPLPTPQEKLIVDDEELDAEPQETTSARRSLMFTPSGRPDQVDELSYSSRISGYSLDQTVGAKRSLLKETAESSLPEAGDTSEKPDLNQNRNKVHNELRPCLATFDAICLISRSTNCSEITKEELVHKILSNNLEIEETSEVEGQLNELELIMPEWISKKAVSGGQFLYCINQTPNPEAFRARLVDAV